MSNLRWLRNSRDDVDPVLQQKLINYYEGGPREEWVDVPVYWEPLDERSDEKGETIGQTT